MATYRFSTCDVFTRTRFGGNPLAVIHDGRGLPDQTMQSIAREFNYSETTFVLPAVDPRHTARVRIFTPVRELPFAGHPTVGTAFVLASEGAFSAQTRDIVFEEGVGPVPVHIERAGDSIVRCTLTTARLPEGGADAPPAPARERLARMLALAPDDILAGTECWSCGLPYLVVPLVSLAALTRCALDLPVWREVLGAYATQKVYPVARVDDHCWRVRMFAPGAGVAEDPATGSAAAAFAGWLARRSPAADGTTKVTLLQGQEIGRPSTLELELDRRQQRTTAVRVGGSSVMVTSGALSVD
jgi:trans-2,3-dihydro-3-hydroxyanthranilate isomerase